MTEYIEREAAIETALSCTDSYEPIIVDTTVKNVAYKLKNIPAADVQPVKHGKWMFTNAFPHHVYCSACHKTYIPNNEWQIWVCGDLPRDYCPNCGARMDGET